MKRPRYTRPKRVLRLPDLDHAKAAVLNTLSSPDWQRSYRFAINDFIAWHRSEPRLALLYEKLSWNVPKRGGAVHLRYPFCRQTLFSIGAD